MFLFLFLYTVYGLVKKKKEIANKDFVKVPRPDVNGMERMCQPHGSDQTPTLLFKSKIHVSINSYSITYAVEEFSTVNNSKLRHCVIVAIGCFFHNN